MDPVITRRSDRCFNRDLYMFLSAWMFPFKQLDGYFISCRADPVLMVTGITRPEMALDTSHLPAILDGKTLKLVAVIDQERKVLSFSHCYIDRETKASAYMEGTALDLRPFRCRALHVDNTFKPSRIIQKLKKENSGCSTCFPSACNGRTRTTEAETVALSPE